MTNTSQIDIDAHIVALRALAGAMQQATTAVEARKVYEAMGKHLSRAEALSAPHLAEPKRLTEVPSPDAA